VFDGVSGAELATVSFQPARGAVRTGVTPTAIAWTIFFRRRRLFAPRPMEPPAVVRVSSWGGASTLAPRSARGIGETARSRCVDRGQQAGNRLLRARRAQLAVADVDGDGTQEIITGSSPSMAMAPDAVRPTWATGWDCTSPISSRPVGPGSIRAPHERRDGVR